MTKTLKVFVYGTLKKGGGNDVPYTRFRVSCKPGKIKGTMYSLGGFPGVVLKGDTDIVGEVHEYTNVEEVEQRMDRLEGYRGKDHPHNFYNKRVVEVATADGLETCIMYEIAHDMRGREKVATGEWPI